MGQKDKGTQADGVPGGQRDQESGWWVLCDPRRSSQQEVGLFPPLFSPRRARRVPSSPGDALLFPLLLSWTHGQEPEVGLGLATAVPAARYRGSPLVLWGRPWGGVGKRAGTGAELPLLLPAAPSGARLLGSTWPQPIWCLLGRTNKLN